MSVHRAMRVGAAALLCGLLAGAGLARGPAATAPAGGDERAVIDPPPITLKLQAASLEQVAAELTRVMGTRIVVWPGGRTNESFTLDVINQPFWDVFSALSRQHPIVPRDASGFSLAAQGWGVQTYVRSGGFIMYPGTLSRRRVASFQAEPGRQLGAEELMMGVSVAADPRIRVVEYGAPQFSHIVDDAGHDLLKQGLPDALRKCDPGRAAVWSFSLDLNVPDKLGARIASAKAEMRFIVQIPGTPPTTKPATIPFELKDIPLPR